MIFVYILDIFISTSSFHSNAMHESSITIMQSIQCPRSSLCHPTMDASTGHPTLWAPVRANHVHTTPAQLGTPVPTGSNTLQPRPAHVTPRGPDRGLLLLLHPSTSHPMGHPPPPRPSSLAPPPPCLPPDCRRKKAFTSTLSDAKTTAGVSLPHSRTPGPCATTYRDRCF